MGGGSEGSWGMVLGDRLSIGESIRSLVGSVMYCMNSSAPSYFELIYESEVVVEFSVGVDAQDTCLVATESAFPSFSGFDSPGWSRLIFSFSDTSGLVEGRLS